MKNKNSRNGGRKRAPRAQASSIRDRIEVVSGADIISFPSSSTGLMPFVPSTFVRLAGIGDNFQLYRFVKATIRVLDTENMSFGYTPGTLDNPPTNTSQAIQQEPSALHFAGQLVPTTLNISRKHFVRDGAVKWWKTEDGSAVETWLEQQGSMFWASGTAQARFFHVKWTCELTGWLASGNTPQFHRAEDPSVIGYEKTEPGLLVPSAALPETFYGRPEKLYAPVRKSLLSKLSVQASQIKTSREDEDKRVQVSDRMVDMADYSLPIPRVTSVPSSDQVAAILRALSNRSVVHQGGPAADS